MTSPSRSQPGPGGSLREYGRGVVAVTGERAQRSGGAFTTYRGVTTFLLLASVASVLTLALPDRATAVAEAAVCVAAAVVASVVAVRSQGTTRSACWLIAAGQAVMSLQGVLRLITAEPPRDVINLALAVAVLLQAGAWLRIGLGTARRLNAATILDTIVIMLGLIGGAVLLGEAARAGLADLSVTQAIGTASSVAMIGAIAFGAMRLVPTPPAYQVLMLPIALVVLLRAADLWLASHGVVYVGQVAVQTAVIMFAFATMAAVLDPGFAEIAQAPDQATTSWSPTRAVGLFGVGILPVWAAAVSVDTESATPWVVFSVLTAVVAILLLRAVVASRAEERARRARLVAALTDSVTGLPNREGLIQGRPDRSPLPDVPSSVVRIWLDDIDDVIETRGPDAAHAVAMLCADALRSSPVTSSSAARLAPGQFAVVVPVEDAVEAVRDVEPLVSGLTVTLEGDPFRVRTSLAAAAVPGTSRRDLDDGLALAGVAHRRPHARGVTPIGTRRQWSERLARTNLAQEILRDQDWTHAVLYGQPFIDAADHSVIGYETLVRWSSPVRGIVPTGEFLATVGAIGMSERLDEHVLGAALRWAGPAGGPPGIISVNVNPATLVRPGMAEQLLERFQARSWPGSTMWLEILEHDLAGDTATLTRALAPLAEAGVRVTIDDFGAGSSTLTRFVDLFVSVVKLDRALVDGVSRDPGRQTVVRGILDIAATMDLRVLAEGIETREDFDTLAGMGCSTFQGFLWAKPAPLLGVPVVGSPLTPSPSEP